MSSPRSHQDYLDDEWRALQAAPLSLRKAKLVAGLIDAHVDRLFHAKSAAGDIIGYRAQVADRSPALGLIMALCSQRAGVAIALQAVAVPLEDYGALSVEDFMVSLYNDHSVQRLRLTSPDGSSQDMLELIEAALLALDGL